MKRRSPRTTTAAAASALLAASLLLLGASSSSSSSALDDAEGGQHRQRPHRAVASESARHFPAPVEEEYEEDGRHHRRRLHNVFASSSSSHRGSRSGGGPEPAMAGRAAIPPDEDEEAAAERRRRRRKRKKRAKKEKEKERQRNRQKKKDQGKPDDDGDGGPVLVIALWKDPQVIYDTFDVEFDIVCADLEGGLLSKRKKAAIEKAFLRYFKEGNKCYPNTDAEYLTATIVQFWDSDWCEENGGSVGARRLQTRPNANNKEKEDEQNRARRSKARVNRNYQCMNCPDIPREDLAEDSIHRRQRALLPDAGGAADGNGATRNLEPGCEANLVDSLNAEGLNAVTDAEVRAYYQPWDCSPTSSDCTSTSGIFPCCGSPGCQCGAVSEILCAANECALPRAADGAGVLEGEDNACCAPGEDDGAGWPTVEFLFEACASTCRDECAVQPYVEKLDDGGGDSEVPFYITPTVELVELCGDAGPGGGRLSKDTRKRLAGDLSYYFRTSLSEGGCGGRIAFDMDGCKVLDFQMTNSCPGGQVKGGSLVKLGCTGTCRGEYCMTTPNENLGPFQWGGGPEPDKNGSTRRLLRRLDSSSP